MVHKAMILAAVLSAVALAGCTSGSDGGGSSDDGTTTGSGGVGGNVTVGNGTAGGNVSASYSSTNSSTNASTPVPSSADVSIDDDQFVPATVTIAVGGTVTWTHNGTNPHTVTDDGEAFDSSPNCGANPLPFLSDCLEQGDTYSATYAEAGSFPYHCKVHGGMTGTVNVVE